MRSPAAKSSTSPALPERRPWIVVSAPARLHLGFIDLHGGLGRRFGSLGLTLEQPRTTVAVRHAERPLAAGNADATEDGATEDSATEDGATEDGAGTDLDACTRRARRFAVTLLTQLGLPDTVELRVREAPPAHAGLGSGTQLALAVGGALARLYQRPLEAADIAARLGRGARSGIGIGAFEQGGFLVDGGHRDPPAEDPPLPAVPPTLCRLAVPEAWRLLLVFDDHCRGVSGDAERTAFGRLPAFGEDRAGRISRRLLMQALPALVEGDCAGFGAAISEIQRQVGDFFAPLQGGRRFTSDAVADALSDLRAHGAAGVGQSSWGPTGFALCASEDQAQALRATLRDRYPQLRLTVTRARNRPALDAA